MNSIHIIVYGITGLFCGFMIPYVSNKIISSKMKQKKTEIKYNFLESGLFRFVICILNGVAWAFAGMQLDPIVALLFSILFSLAVLFSIIDIRIHIIPNQLVLITFAVGALFQFIHFGGKSLLIAAICSLVMMVLFTIVGFIVGLNKVGAGDVKLAGVMGMVLGYPLILVAVFSMSLALIAYCVIGISINKLTLVSMFPFAPFMMLGMVIALGSSIL